MQYITFEVSDQFHALLAKQGIISETATVEFLEKLVFAYADDVLLGESAKRAQQEGYIGIADSEKLLNDMLHTKD